MRFDRKPVKEDEKKPAQPKVVKVVKEFQIPGTKIIAEEGDELLVFGPNDVIPEPEDELLNEPSPEFVASYQNEFGVTAEEARAACEALKKNSKKI